MTKDRDTLGQSAAEAAFFGTKDDASIDEELVALAHGPHALIPLILILLAGFASFLIKQYWTYAIYALESQDATRICDVLDWQTTFDADEGRNLTLYQNY